MGNGGVILVAVSFGSTLFTIYCVGCVLNDMIKAKRRRLNAKNEQKTDRKVQ